VSVVIVRIIRWKPVLTHSSIVRGNDSIKQLFKVVLCDTHNASILTVDDYTTIPVLPRSRYTAVYRSSTKYRETAQVSRVLSIPYNLCHLAFSNVSKVAENHSTTTSAWLQAAVNKYSPIYVFTLAQHYTHKTVQL